MKARIRPLLRIVGVVIAALSLFYIALQLWQAWPQLARLEIDPALALLALFFGSFSLFLYALLWRRMLQQLDEEISLKAAVRIWFISQIVRYAPGNVWHLLGRAYLANEEGINSQSLSISLIFELIQTITAALLVALISLLFWPEWDILTAWTLLVIPLFALYIWPRLFYNPLHWLIERSGRKQQFSPVRGRLERRDLFGLLPGYCLTWLSYGCGLYLLARAIYPLPLSALPVITGIFGIAWVIGFMSFITPSGLGVREGVLAHLLSLLMPLPVALLLAILARVWLTVAELGCAAIVAVSERR